MLRKVILLASLPLVLGACASLKRSDVGALAQAEPSSGEVLQRTQVPYVSPLGPVPLDDHPLVDQWVKYFMGRGRKHMEVYLERSARYLPMMQNVLRENGLPEELVYVALIESGFSPRAHSSANAVGYWQFIRPTGRRYGLKVDGLVDERRDPVLSTRAAADYFKALYAMFDSWHLSLASYNAGENRLKRASKRYRTKDFWALTKGRILPKETRHYVPKYIAATRIAQNPEMYGFSKIDYQKALAYETVTVTEPISMSALSTNLGVDIEEMRLLNPKFRGDYVPIYRGTEIVLRVPTGKAQEAIAAVANSKATEPPKVLHADNMHYRVRSGDSLSTIARRHRTSVRTLRRLNNLGSRSFIRVGQRILVPDRGDVYYAQNESVQVSSATRSEMAPARNVGIHVVRRGDNLSTIARRYGVTIQQLRELNNLGNRSMLSVGQRLKLREDDSASRRAPAKTNTIHVVRRGENLTLIARNYRTTPKELMRANKLKRSVLHVGQRLKVSQKVHIVRRGETLSQIATRYEVPLSKIVRANSLENKSLILAGLELVIPKSN